MNPDEELLSKAFAALRTRTLSELPELEEPHAFSEAFEGKMQALLLREKQAAAQRRMRRIGRRAACFALAGLAGLSVCVMSVDAWREKLFHMVEQKFPEYSNISYEPVAGANSALPSDFKLVEYRPAYLPEGMVLTDQMLHGNINWSYYRNGTDNGMAFHQSLLGTVGSAINTEGSELEEFELSKGDTAYKMSNMGTQFVLWNDNQYEYMITLNGYSLDEAVRIAESVTLCPPDAPHPPHLTVQLDNLQGEYPPEQALADGMVVIRADGVDNLNLVDRFLEGVQAGEQSILGLCDYTRGTPYPTEVYFDGFRVNTTVDETRSNEKSEEGTVGKNYDAIERVQEGADTVVFLVEDGLKTELLRYTE